MTFPWLPVIIVDIVGSAFCLAISLWSFVLARKWYRQNREDSLRLYMYLLTAAIVLFAVSRSIGHLAKQWLLFSGLSPVWHEIAPYSGAINTTTFIMIFAIGIYFQWHRKAYQQVQDYKVHLEDAVTSLENKSNKLETAYHELQETQQQMLQQEKMASIGQLAAGVAHEINNPLGFMTSNLRSLLKYIGRLCQFGHSMREVIRDDARDEIEKEAERLKIDFIEDDARDLVNESLDGAARISRIVRGLKSFSRVDTGDSKPQDINECLENTLTVIWNELKYKARIHKEFGKIPLVECFPQQLSQVFMNLLINASHAIKEKGQITIKTWHEDGSVFVSISDNGQGIAPEHLEKLFEPFFTTKEVGKGTGLGLSISYEIIQKHHGSIDVTSQPGEGSTFTISLPVQLPKMSA